MSVLVTGAEHPVGRHAVRRLLSTGDEVRVFLDLERPDPADPDELRALGCKVAQGALDDEGHLETACAQTHTVFHLAAHPLERPAHLVEQAAAIVAAALGAGCRRLVFVSDLAATDPQGNPWLDALAQVEALLADLPLETVVLRCALTWDHHDPLVGALLAAGDVPDGRHWPAWAGDVAAAAVAADREPAHADDLHVVAALSGPQRLTVAGLRDALRSRGPAAGPRDLPAHTRQWLARDIDRPDEAITLHTAPGAPPP